MRGQYGSDEYGGFEYGAAGVVGTISAPTTDIRVGDARSDGATFPWTFPQTFGERLEPTLVYQITTPTTDISVDAQEPTVPASGTAPIETPTTEVTIATLLPGVGYLDWQIAGAVVPRATNEIATPRTLSLVLRVESETLLNDVRGLKSDEGKVDVLARDDGGFVAVDRADGDNTYELIPPIFRQPLRQTRDYHVDRYEESLVSQSVDEWDVELDLVQDADRTDTPSVSQTPAADEWGFTTRYGEIATGRVDATFAGTGEDGVERFDILARLTFEQCHVFEAALARLGAGRVRDIPDATNVAVDATSGNVATVTVDAPNSQNEVADGDYLVTEWQSERLNDAFQEVEFTLAAKN